jgi:hypothetical protein
VDKKVVILLTPESYWYKNSDIALKSVSKAQKIAKSIFFSWIPDGEYRYFAFKEENGFGFIALDHKKILNELEESGLKLNLIDKIIFAQTALSKDDSPIIIDDKTALGFLDNSWVILPKNYLENSKDIDQVSSIDSRISYKVTAIETSEISRNSIIFIALISFLIFASIVLEIVRKTGEITSLELQKEELITKAKLPPTKMQLSSIHKRLDKLSTDQKELRENLSKFVSISLSPATVLEMKASVGAITAVIQTKSLDNEATTANKIKKEFKNAKIITKDGLLAVEIRW